MDFAGLIAQVVDTLGSQVTTAQATALLPLVEARFNRIIDSPEREVEYSFTPTGDATLPTDCWQLRDIWLVATATGTADVSVRQVSPQTARTLYGYETGTIQAFVLSGRTLDFWPTPGATSTQVVKLRYQQTIPALSATTTTNWLITKHPDIYYYGLLLQCEAYIVNDERLGIWKTALDEALNELNSLSGRQSYSVAPIAPRIERYV